MRGGGQGVRDEGEDDERWRDDAWTNDDRETPRGPVSGSGKAHSQIRTGFHTVRGWTRGSGAAGAAWAAREAGHSRAPAHVALATRGRPARALPRAKEGMSARGWIEHVRIERKGVGKEERDTYALNESAVAIARAPQASRRK